MITFSPAMNVYKKKKKMFTSLKTKEVKFLVLLGTIPKLKGKIFIDFEECYQIVQGKLLLYA